MKYLIDGHNLIGKLPHISLSDPDDEAQLVQMLARWRWRHKNAPVTVVFDPGEVAIHGRRHTQQSGIQIHYAPQSTNADLVITDIIERTQQTNQLTVISSDREIQSAARLMGTHVITAEEFARDLMTPIEQDNDPFEDFAVAPDEVDAWLKIFQNSDDT